MRNTKIFVTAVLTLSFIALLFSCSEPPIPKPRAFIRIDIPEHQYKQVETDLPIQFEYADYAFANTIIDSNKKWINIHYPTHKATIYFSYFNIDNNLNKLLQDAHGFAYKHISKATNIDEQIIVQREKDVYGLVYNIIGTETATPINFYLTDSVNHFIRGSLYFDILPNNDSLAPVIRSIDEDISHMIETLEWK